MKNLLLFFLLLITFKSFSQSGDELAIRKVLAAQQSAWNQGNIDAFMKGYWNNDSLTFTGKSGVTYGWSKTLATYKKNYPDTSAMGKLTFTLLNLTPLSPELYQVIGKWQVKRSIGSLEGHFTLIFRKINGQWLIITDHSS